MNELIKNLNLTIGKLRAHAEILSESRWHIVDASIPGFPQDGQWYKSELLRAVQDSEKTLCGLVTELQRMNFCKD